MELVLDDWTVWSNIHGVNRGRPLEFDPETATDAAMRLFWRQGFESSSLQELLVSTHLSKSSFYQSFRSKRALFQQCLLRYQALVLENLSKELARAPSARDFIRSTLHGVVRQLLGEEPCSGCFLVNTADEFAQTDEEMAQIVKHGFRAFEKFFERAIRLAQIEGKIAEESNCRALAQYMMSSLCGLRTMVRSGADAGTIRRVVGVIDQGFE